MQDQYIADYSYIFLYSSNGSTIFRFYPFQSLLLTFIQTFSSLFLSSQVLEDFGYIYDSSITVPPVPVPVWPYTLDYKISHECKSGTCPSRTFPGVWEVPLNTHYVEGFEGGHCPYMDQCVLHNLDEQEVFEWLQEDFSRYYEQNKAPYMMPFHTNWFQTKPLENGLHKFLDWALEL